MELGLGQRSNQLNHRSLLWSPDFSLSLSVFPSFFASFLTSHESEPPRAHAMATKTESQTEAGTCGSDLLPNIFCISRRKITGPEERGQRGRKWESLGKFLFKQLSEKAIHLDTA